MEIKELNTYIEDRFQANFSTLINDSNYSELTKEFNYKYEQFVQQISKNNLSSLEELLEIKNILSSKEVYLSYKIGLNDGIHISNNIN